MAVKFSQFNVETDVANVGYLVGYDGTDNVQITPANLIASSSIIDGSGTAGKIPKWVDSETLTDSIMTEGTGVITLAGEIEITGSGTNTIVTSSTAKLLIESTGANGNDVYLGLKSSDTTWLLKTNRGDEISGNQGDFFIREDTAGVNALILETNTGNATFAGIVTTDKIFVAKGQNLSHGTSLIKISQESTAKSQIRFYGADTATPGSLEFMGSSSDGSAGDVRMTISSAGLVAINTTPQFNRELLVKGEIAAFAQDSGDNQLLMGATSTQVNLSATYGSSGSYVPMQFETGGVVRMTVGADGNVKLGNATTGTPAVNADDLVIDKGATESGITIVSTTAGSLRFGDAANTSIGYIEYGHSSNNFNFGTNGSSAMTIDSSGNVDIGGVGGSAVRFTARGSGTGTTSYSIEGCNSAGTTKFPDGVYKVVFTGIKADDSVTTESNCFFMDCSTSCEVAKYIKNLLKTPADVEAHLLHFGLVNGSNCNCNCDEMCSLYTKLYNILNNTEACLCNCT